MMTLVFIQGHPSSILNNKKRWSLTRKNS